MLTRGQTYSDFPKRFAYRVSIVLPEAWWQFPGALAS
jgi:hypothetical protein